MNTHRRTTHGNPTIFLGDEGAQRPGRLVVLPVPSTAKPVWCSNPILKGEEAVRVDAWNGEFHGHQQGGCLLPAGRYTGIYKPEKGKSKIIETFQVQNRLLFDGSFSAVEKKWFEPAVEWHKDGIWQSASKGIFAPSGPAFLFCEGDMHGDLEGWVTPTSNLDSTKTWGFIGRHYNAAHHLRLVFNREEDHWMVHLIRMGAFACASPFLGLAQADYPFSPEKMLHIRWRLNGERHEVEINGRMILEARDGYMGGVTVMGFWSETPGITWNRFSMNSTQSVPLVEVKHRDYRAMIRPGNIHRFYLSKSQDPSKNICWESGIQFGHIGGSEIKFTQNARLTPVYQGSVLTQVSWEGPMPKFVDQSHDVRGYARGQASFYSDKIVLADYVLCRVRRSVGPDIDLLSRVLSGPARIATRHDPVFQDWILPQEGSSQPLKSLPCGQAYPLAIIFPLRLGNQSWWLKVVLGNLLNVEGTRLASIFGWVCPHRLTASHDFRVAPTEPGTEYGFSILLSWQRSETPQEVEQDVLNLLEDWYRPVQIKPLKGSTVSFLINVENPAQAISFDGCFDRATGLYHVFAEQETLELALDPEGIPRRSLAFRINGLDSESPIQCTWNNKDLIKGADYVTQNLTPQSRLVVIRKKIIEPVRLNIGTGTRRSRP
jgi:hypothetical protein